MVWYSSLVYCHFCNSEDQISDTDAQILANNPYICEECISFGLTDADAPYSTGTCINVLNKFDRRYDSEPCNEQFKFQKIPQTMCMDCVSSIKYDKITYCQYCKKSTGDYYAKICTNCTDLIHDLKHDGDNPSFHPTHKVIATYNVPSKLHISKRNDDSDDDSGDDSDDDDSSITDVTLVDSDTIVKVLPLIKSVKKSCIDVLGFINISKCPESFYYTPNVSWCVDDEYDLISLKVVKKSDLFDYDAYDVSNQVL